MAKKKNKRRKPLPKDFSNSPFKHLEGLSALGAESRESATVGPDRKQPLKMEPGYDETPTAFADEMAFLGVRPLSGGKPGNLVPDAGGKRDTTAVPGPQNDASEENFFLHAIGSMEKVFKDEWGEDLSAKRAVPRRMRQLQRGQLEPEAELDLHGMTVDEATGRALSFMQNAIFQGFRTVLLITGKGLHSEDGPVLRNAMERLLNQNNEQVIEWGVAPRRYGGEGALVVFLRKAEQANT